MRFIILHFAIWIPSFFFNFSSFLTKSKSDNYHSPKSSSVNIPASNHISDMVLIYHGGSQRPVWEADQLKHYLYRTINNELEWLFDGFLFLEIRAEINNKQYDFGVAKSSTLKPTKVEWEWLLNKTFAPSVGPAAIDYLLDSLCKSGKPAPFKRKITIGIPNPIKGTANWGSLKSGPLDFDKDEDRVAAAKWYVDQVINRFKKKKYKHIELDGFYWINESINQDLSVIKQITEYVHKKRMKICWIPYNYAPGADKWKIAGFDIAYQQSNYFFRLDRPLKIIDNALSFARDNNMAMEMEFDGKVFKPDFIERFFTTVDQYDKFNVWQSPSVAYYEGGGTWLNMATSTNPGALKAYNDLGDIIVTRQKRHAEKLNKSLKR